MEHQESQRTRLCFLVGKNALQHHGNLLGEMTEKLIPILRNL